VARRLGRDLLRIKLGRFLERRVGVEVLVQKGVLPGECYGEVRGRGRGVAMGLVGVKRVCYCSCCAL